MDPVSRARLFGVSDVFDWPITLWGTVVVAALLVFSPLLVLLLSRAGKIDADLRKELMLRCGSWAVIAPALLVPVLLGAAWWIGMMFVLSALCLREFGRITGVFREPMVMGAAYLGLLALYFAILDNWYTMFAAVTPITAVLILAAAILSDRPSGYVQRVALGILGFALFGTGLGHLAFFANDAQYRPMLFIIIAAVQGNDVFAYLCGKTMGKRRLCPNTSPNKTVAGAVGAVVCTTTLVVCLGHFVVADGMQVWRLHLLAAGVLLSIAGQMGDLVLSSVKRDIGIKDTGTILPGHGGLLDRFDSLLLASPVIFYFVAYFRGIGLDQPARVLTGG
ncbi:phosphatidate cytidylyltransferase [Algisphaera agarilytica]|uniref:Phosphatidate cytidylyltransferase n=1 Tax=Algisphaera agarilytica TaxID=1385975 RepID=A0A7X0H3Z4_9BACT|nr:phosphatidate cytidylyltransferase [Algisphaera agarilytica]MBB6428653.1 phosphatidate cytidylyltransferase [Algisphaera agarilytica]